MDLSDARVGGGRVGQAALEVRVYGRCWQLGGQGAGVLQLGAVSPGLVDKAVDGYLSFMRIVAVPVSNGDALSSPGRCTAATYSSA